MHRSFIDCSLIITLVFCLGCTAAQPPDHKADEHAGPDDHGAEAVHAGEGDQHESGPHGGMIVDWGGGAYHVELVVHPQRASVVAFILGSDEKTTTPIATSKLLLSLEEPFRQFELLADPLPTQSAGTSSRFVGHHDSLTEQRKFTGSILGEVAGVPYAGDF